MRTSWWIVVLCAILIAAAGVGAWWLASRPEPGPRENVTPPEGVVNNVFIALSEGAYSQAYGYLSTPYRRAHTLGDFVDAVRPIWDDVASIAVQIDAPVVEGDETRVNVTLRATLKEGAGSDRASFQGPLRLVREGVRGAWWLDDLPYPVPKE